MTWGNEFVQKWYGDWDKVRISIRILNQIWSYEQSHWPELLAFVVVKGKYSAVGGTKITKERGYTKMWVLRLPPLASLWCFFMEYSWVICQIHHRGVWTDCLLLPLLFLMGSSQQAATEPFVFHQSLLLSFIPPYYWSLVFATSFALTPNQVFILMY